MSPTCKSVCKKYKTRKTDNHKRYLNGQKFCLECGIFLKWEGLWCPCCGIRLRSRPRNRRKSQSDERVYIE